MPSIPNIINIMKRENNPFIIPIHLEMIFDLLCCFPSKKEENQELKDIEINSKMFIDAIEDYSQILNKHIFECTYQRFLTLIKLGKCEKEFYKKLAKNKHFKKTFPTFKKFIKFMNENYWN